MKLLFLCAAMLPLASMEAATQSRPPAAVQRVTITGRVIADDTGDPLPNARVALHPAGDASPTVILSDAAGRFTIGAAGGGYELAASKTGYARRALSSPASPVDIRLKRSAAIAGRVVDDFGDAVVGIRVAAEAPSRTAANSTTTFETTTTDDLGEYRLAGLADGDVIVSVVQIQTLAVDPRGRTGPERTYYPGVAKVSDAETLRLGPGTEKLGIDFVVPAREPPAPALMPGPGGQLVTPPRLNTGAGTVRGQVRTTDGRAVPHASVMLVATRVLQWQSTVSDSNGTFEIRDVPAGRYRVSANKAGYSYIAPPAQPGGNALASEAAFDLTAGETRDRIALGLTRGRALTGRIFDELGDPLQGVTVSLMQVRYEAGRQRLVPVAAATRVTDDLGRYRLFDVAPGHYIVSAAIGAVFSDDVPGYARSYFPGTASAGEAQYVPLGASADAVGIDFALSRTRTARISGRAIDAAGSPIGGGLRLVSSRTSVVAVSFNARIQPDGAFEFPNVPPGQYVIQAYRGRLGESTEGEFGALSVAVDGRDVSGLTLQTAAGSRVSGRIRLDSYSGVKPPAPSSIVVSPIPVDFDAAPAIPAVAEVKSDWTFQLDGINGARRLQVLRTPPEWTLSAIRVNGVDLTDRPLQFGGAARALTDVEVVLTDRASALTVAVIDDRRMPVPGASVIVFSMSRDDWYPASRFLRRAIAGADGTVSIRGLPAGSFQAAAITASPSDDDERWQDPALLDALAPEATVVAVSDDRTQSLTLRPLARPRP